MVLVVALIIFLLDLAFDFMYKFEVDQVRKLQNNISVNETVDNTTTGNTNTTEDTNTTSEETNATTENETASENSVSE